PDASILSKCIAGLLWAVPVSDHHPIFICISGFSSFASRAQRASTNCE
ncbi:MAG: hypothetical protein ACI9U2_002175, partial [Bradymonadia bacterium]